MTPAGDHTSRVPFGAWPSPLTPELAAEGGVRFAGVSLSRDRRGEPILWFSVLEAGSNVVRVARPGGGAKRVAGVVSARSRVNEYGGGGFWTHGETLFWTEDHDQRIRMLDLGGGDVGDDVGSWGGFLADRCSEVVPEELTGSPVLLTAEPPHPRSTRYAAGVVEPGGAWMVVEREVHSRADGSPLSQPVNDLAVVPIDGSGSVRSVVSGPDFCAAPVLSPDGRYLAWLQWNHPDMPWDAAELWAGRIVSSSEGTVEVSDRRRVVGGRGSGGVPGGDDVSGSGGAVSVCLPAWDPTGRLWWCDDREDRWVLRRSSSVGPPGQDSGWDARTFHDGGGEVGAPRWVSGGSRYGFVDGPDGTDVVLAESVAGLDRLVTVRGGGTVDSTVDPERVDPGWIDPGWIDMVVADGSSVAAVAGSPTEPTSVVWRTAGPDATDEPLERFGQRPWALERGSISEPEPVSFPTGGTIERAGSASARSPARSSDGVRTGGGPIAHGLFYPPLLEGFEGDRGEAPPLVVRIHGGPTAAARAELSSSVQFWTTRGFAVVEVNYRGSTGYGRDYRNQLLGGWGRVEVQDCIAAAEFLAGAGRVDPRRCVIRGGSAGGFSALEALCAPPTATGFRFAAATTLYGVTDLMTLVADTHKFESRYLDGLVGPLPEAEATYRERSPLNHPERISAPVLILQGLEDPVVPPSQAEVLVDALRAAGVDHEYRTYPGEGHGFRNEATIADALGAELAFYRRILRIPAPG